MATSDEEEEPLLRSVALQNAHSILQARERAESELLEAREALRESQERLTAALAAASTARSAGCSPAAPTSGTR